MRKLWLAAVAAACALVFGAFSFGGAALAKWYSSYSVGATGIHSKPADVKLSVVDWNDQPLEIDRTVKGDLVLSLEFGPTEAEAIAYQSRKDLTAKGNGEVFWAKAYQLEGTADGTMGFKFAGQVPSLTGSAYGRELVLYRTSSAAECTPEQVKDSWGSLPGQSGAVGSTQEQEMTSDPAIPTRFGHDKSYSQVFCLATRFAPERLSNTATATATANGVPVMAEDSWHAFSLPGHLEEPLVKFEFEVVFLSPPN
ncbi:MAG: hypothetical protein LBJ02_10125 [Bifidobacteriaceae bacterium]|jgi:hypothetical protein|nr:hypothetical protein [Bifidobacteriaceae bacterium]